MTGLYAYLFPSFIAVQHVVHPDNLLIYLLQTSHSVTDLHVDFYQVYMYIITISSLV